MADKPEVTMTYSQEQAVSVNAFMDVQIEGETLRLQITARNGASPDDIERVVKHLISGCGGIRKTYPRPNVPVPETPSEPERVPVDENGNELPPVKTFTADTLSVDMHEDKLYVKVKGKPFTQYGVPVWPEVLKAAGLEIVVGQPAPNIVGWRADYIEKDGKEPGKKVPAKVVRLLPPK